MKLRILGLAAALLMTTTAAQAAWSANDIAQHYLDLGYTRVEVEMGATWAKVEAIKGSTKLEVILDLATGDVLKSETGRVDTNDNVAPGVFVGEDDDTSIDDELDDSGDDSQDDLNDDRDDDSGNGSDDDDDQDDDNGGDDDGEDDSGDDHDSSDDHGGDDSDDDQNDDDEDDKDD